MRPVRVLQIIDTLAMGGAETWLINVLRACSRAGSAQLEFLMTGGQRAIFDDEAERLGARLHYLMYSRRTAIAFARGFRQLLHAGRFDAVHDHQDYVSGWHFLMGAGSLPRVRVTHVHNPAYQITANRNVKLGGRLVSNVGRRLVARYATHITGTSRQILDEYGFDAPLFDHIPKAALYCGIDVAQFAGEKSVARSAVRDEFGWPESAKIVLFAGRTDRSADSQDPQNHKNSAFAVDVAIEAARRDPGICFIFAGAESPATPILRRRIGQAGCGERIALCGVRRDVARLMRAADALLFPSRAEGLGMVAVEAQAAGLPVLASSTVPREMAVVPELVRFKEVADGAAAWSEELRRIASGNSTVSDANQRVAASSFSLTHSVAALLRLYGQGSVP